MTTMTQVGIAAVNFVCGFILVIGSYVMEGLEETQDMQRWLVHLFRCVPPFNLGALRHLFVSVACVTNAVLIKGRVASRLMVRHKGCGLQHIVKSFWPYQAEALRDSKPRDL